MTIAKNPWRWIFLGMTVLWMGFIFGMSGSTGDQSQETSGRLASLVQQLFFQNWETLPEEEFLAALGQLNFFLRKLAHFTEFAVLGGLVSLVLMTFQKPFGFRFGMSLLVGALYAVTDELHQLFVSARSAALFDVLVDTAGVFSGCVVVLGFFAMIASDREKRKSAREETEALPEHDFKTNRQGPDRDKTGTK